MKIVTANTFLCTFQCFNLRTVRAFADIIVKEECSLTGVSWFVLLHLPHDKLREQLEALTPDKIKEL